jgi:hypothetical protein
MHTPYTVEVHICLEIVEKRRMEIYWSFLFTSLFSKVSCITFAPFFITCSFLLLHCVRFICWTVNQVIMLYTVVPHKNVKNTNFPMLTHYSSHRLDLHENTLPLLPLLLPLLSSLQHIFPPGAYSLGS